LLTAPLAGAGPHAGRRLRPVADHRRALGLRGPLPRPAWPPRRRAGEGPRSGEALKVAPDAPAVPQ